MRREEAAWIGEALAQIAPEALSPLLEVGSSTGHFRRVVQPHIDTLIHAPLRARGVRVVHADLREGEGIDIAGDIYDPVVFERLRAVGANSVLCCNMFEHVVDRALLASRLQELAAGRHLIVTVPYSYPIHLDPIDTYFRPSPEGIAALFPGSTAIASAIIESDSYGAEMTARGGRARRLLTQARHLLAVWVGPRRWVARNHRLLWLTRPYRISAVVLRLA